MLYMWFSMGVFFGAIVANIGFYLKTARGTFRIDHSNPEKDVYRLEIDSLDKIDKKKRLILKIDHHADLSQK